MNLELSFSINEKIKFLGKLGYEVKKINYEMSYPVYHDDIEYENREVWAVSKNGAYTGKPHSQNFDTEEWLDGVFEKEITKKIKKSLLK